MSGTNLIDDYLSELMDDPQRGKPGDKPAATPAATPAADAAGEIAEATPASDDEDEPALAPAAASAAPAAAEADDDASEVIAMPSEASSAVAASAEPAPAEPPAPATPAVDPLDAFRGGPSTISDDEFEAMLDALQGQPPATAASAAPVADEATAPAPAGDPLAAFRDGGAMIDDSEFEAMLDALQGKGTPATAAPAPAPVPTPAPTSAPAATASAARAAAAAVVDEPRAPLIAPPPASAPAPLPARGLDSLGSPPIQNPAPVDPLDSPTRRRRAEDRMTSWLRFSLARQVFAVEVLKVQEVLRVPVVLPVRGTEPAMLGVMNLRGQIVPVMDLALRLGFPSVETTEASRVIVLEEGGETLGLLVAQVADVVNLSDGRMERISGTPSLIAAEVVRGIARREGQIIILLDATKLLV